MNDRKMYNEIKPPKTYQTIGTHLVQCLHVFNSDDGSRDIRQLNTRLNMHDGAKT
jgi:hypothetical protein